MVELLNILSLVAYIAAGVLFLVAVALFFLIDVPKLFGDLSGRTAKRAIEEIRQQNELDGNKGYRTSVVNSERGKLTDKISQSGRLQIHTAGLPISVGTEKISAQNWEQLSNETTLLVSNSSLDGGETTLLVDERVYATSTALDEIFTIDVEMSFAESSEIIL